MASSWQHRQNDQQEQQQLAPLLPSTDSIAQLGPGTRTIAPYPPYEPPPPPPQQQQQQQHASEHRYGPYRRASRKGAPKKFRCEHEGCDKIYTRQEHLQRHQLNHFPKQIYACDVQGCDQKFVRQDLLQRHKKRHTANYFGRHAGKHERLGPLHDDDDVVLPEPASMLPPHGDSPPGPESSSERLPALAQPLRYPDRRVPFSHPSLTMPPIVSDIPRKPSFTQHSPNMPHDAAILLTPESSSAQPSSATPHPQPSQPPPSQGWLGSAAGMPPRHYEPPKGFYSHGGPPLARLSGTLAFPGTHFENEEAIIRNNFTSWLFDPSSMYNEIGLGMPFWEGGGLESPFDSRAHYDHESLTSRSQFETPPRVVESDDLISEDRYRLISHYLHSYRLKQPKAEPVIANLIHDSATDVRGMSMDMMHDCLHEYWEHVSPRLPIIHEATFACNRCPILLLMVMIALGAASLHSRDTEDRLSHYATFADVIIISIRWEIHPHEEASPPVALWVAQALLLVEFYEKMYSSRRLHERAHIYHSVTLTLLRRGSPLIGRSGSESPPEERPATRADNSHAMTLDSSTWWIRWAETEAMHRVVFAAFMLDILHAAMFGHEAHMAPHEIRLPLPCDDNLWVASSPDVVRQLDSNLRMYGVKPVSFLDGLKRALHGKEVKTHGFGRMIIMSGLLSVGWHLRHRETHLKWLDITAPRIETQDTWRMTLLGAFDEWNKSFEDAQGSVDSSPNSTTSQKGESTIGPIQSASLLYHLAHICLHVDIVDCQVYAGAKRLLGRKISTRDYNNVTTRMKTWAKLPSTRHAVLHAFKLLFRVLVATQQYDGNDAATAPADPRRTRSSLPGAMQLTYSCRTDPDPHRPWIMYYAALSIWSYVRAVSAGSGRRPSAPRATEFVPAENHRRVAAYLSQVAVLNRLDEYSFGGMSMLYDGLLDLLDELHHIFLEARSELLQEACDRMKACREILISGQG